MNGEIQISEQRKKQIVAISKVGGGLILGAIIAPMVFIAVQGILGLCLGAVIILAAINAWPIVVDGMANMKLRGIKWMSQQNPIETLEKDLQKREEALETFKVSITDFGATLLGFEDKFDEYKKKDPEYAQKLEENFLKLKKLLDLRKKKYKEAQVAVTKYSAEIDRAKGRWEMGLEAAKMNKAAGIISGEDFMDKLKSDTAFDSVNTLLNSAFSEMEMSLIPTEDEKGFPPIK